MKNDTPTVLVLMGGPDAERPVSLASGREVVTALQAGDAFNVLEAVVDQCDAAEIARLGGDVIFPVLHGPWGEGGGLQQELEALGQPYVGSPPGAAAIAMDKLLTKTTLAPEGIPFLESHEFTAECSCPLTPPVVIKPIDDGSSIDVFICRSEDDIDAARAAADRRRSPMMVERYISGPELTVGLLGDLVLPVIQILPAVESYDYAAKYERDDTQYVIDPPLSQAILHRATELSKQAFEVLGCRDLARVDFMLEGEDLWLLEINTMPGFTTHSLVPKAAQSIGIQFPELCERLVRSALLRHRHETISSLSSQA